MRLRVSIRVLMVVIVIAALCAGPGYKTVQTLRKRSRDYDEIAKMSVKQVRQLKLNAAAPYLTAEERESHERLIGWYERRIGPYTRAASRPWLTVTDEPRPPLVWSTPLTPTQTPVMVWKPPPVPKPSKPLKQMTEAEKNAYRLQVVKHIQDLGKTLKGEIQEKRGYYSTRPLKSPKSTDQ